MSDNIYNEIEKLPHFLFSIKEQGKKYYKNNSKIDSYAIHVLHRPWVAPYNWGLSLFKGVNPDWLTQFTKLTNKAVPDFYRDFLLAMNGCFIYDMALYGLTPSLYNNGILNRTMLECFDLTTANNNWILEYDIPNNLFHFGGRAYSDSENIGYFIGQNQNIKAIRKNGQEIHEWVDFKTFLTDEIAVAEKIMKSEIPKGTVLIIE
jgi:hypothetical protein